MQVKTDNNRLCFFTLLHVAKKRVIFVQMTLYIKENVRCECLQCGKVTFGRPDKKFCSDDCRADYHNGRRRVREKELRAVNQILSSNWRILMQQLRLGRHAVPVAELAARNFNFEIYTATQRRFPGRRIYWCYNFSYQISWTGIVHINAGDCRNNP